MKVKEESETVDLKLNIQKTKIKASGPITSWQIDGETVETVTNFIFGGLQSHCKWWLQSWNKKMLAPWKESYDQPRQHIKSRDITLPTEIHLVKAIVFPVVMYGCESWTIKKVEHWRIDAFELWCWRRLLRVSWKSRRSNQSFWSSNTLATWWEELTHWKRPWGWERLTVGEEDNRGGDGWMASPRQWTWIWVNSGSWYWTGSPGVMQSRGSQRVGYNWATELNWRTSDPFREDM